MSSFSRFILTYVMIKERLHCSKYWASQVSLTWDTRVSDALWCHDDNGGDDDDDDVTAFGSALTRAARSDSLPPLGTCQLFFSACQFYLLQPPQTANTRQRQTTVTLNITHLTASVTTVCVCETCVYLHPSTEQQIGAVSAVLTDRDAGPAQKHTITKPSSHFNPIHPNSTQTL